MGKNAKKRSRAGVILPVAALAAGLLWAGNFTLSLTEMTVSSVSIPAVFDGFRIALVTDLHGRTFGPDNDWLVGQLTNAHRISLRWQEILRTKKAIWQVLSRLLPRLAAIAPCYYVTGNHEWRMENRKQWFELLSACGVTRLENSFVMLSREGGSVVLAGVDDRTDGRPKDAWAAAAGNPRGSAAGIYDCALPPERSAGALRAPGRRSGFERACARRRGPAALPWRGLRHAL